jgi:hypothetical protein
MKYEGEFREGKVRRISEKIPPGPQPSFLTMLRRRVDV